MKLIGAMLIIFGCFMYGRERVEGMRRRVKSLLAVISALETMRGDIQTAAAPMADIAQRLARDGPDETRELFNIVAKRMPDLPESGFAAIWSEAVSSANNLVLTPEEAETLRALGLTLGKFESGEQCRAISRCIDMFGAFREEARVKSRGDGRLYTGLSIAGGIMLAVMLA